MKKKLNLNLLENADNQTLEDLSENYRAVSEKEAERIFHRVIKNEEVFQSEDDVHGIEIYHRSIWRKAFVVAATFIIITGVAGGGAYYFSQLRNINNVIEENTDNTSIYSRLKANRRKYAAMDTVMSVFDNSTAGFPDLHYKEQEKFYEYMDQFDMQNEIDPSDFLKVPKSITFKFITDEDNSGYIFIIYENGYCSWTERFNGEEKTTYHKLPDGEKNFNDLLKLYNLDSICPDWDNVAPEEIKSFVEKNFESRNEDTVYAHIDNITKNYKTVSKSEIMDIIVRCEWERATEFEYNDYYDISGVSVNKNGFMSGNYNGYYVVYRLKDDAEFDILSQIWESCIYGDLNEAFKLLYSERTAQWFQGPTYLGQGNTDFDTVTLYYTITDPVSFADGLASLDWIHCERSELDDKMQYYGDKGYIVRGCYEFIPYGYFGRISLLPDGYLSVEELGSYKLEKDSDIEKLRQLTDKYLNIDTGSVIAEKLWSGMTNYDNLKAHYTYELSYDDGTKDTISGYLSVDAKNEKMYVTGEGNMMYFDNEQTVEIVMNGHDTSAFITADKETGKTERAGIYRYSNGMANPPPGNHYFYLCKDIEMAIAPRMLTVYTEGNHSYEISEADGCIEGFLSGENGEVYRRIVLTEKGQLISYEFKGGNVTIIFKLDDYVFDSPDFTMEDVSVIYENMKNEDEELYG